MSTIAPNGHSSNTEINNIYTATSVAEIRASLTELSHRENSITTRLHTLLTTQKDLARTLSRLDLARAHLGSQALATRSISNGMLGTASRTASRISSAVRTLDREQAAVKSTLDVVEQVAELKACVLGVNGSMGAPQDWETAASYLQRAREIPESVIEGAFAEEVVPTAEVPDSPRVTLEVASEGLCGLFLREFEKAAREGDGGRVTRFFKLFPLIGRKEVGLDAYGRYVCSGVAGRARQNMNNRGQQQQEVGMFYAGALTKLFEHIAQIVDGHEPLVERHYGVGSMTKVVERIQMEADVQGGIILDTWAEERRVGRKLTDVKSYPFNFLMQSFLPSSKSSATPRSGSPAPGRRSEAEDETVDMKEINALLNESALMLGRWTLYTRFLASKTTTTQDPHLLHIPTFITDSTLASKISTHLTDPFNTMSTFFFRRSVEKAFQLDESPAPSLSLSPSKPIPANVQPPFITSAVDDVMYIVNQVLQRVLSTGQKNVVASVVPSIGRVLGSDFFGMVQRRMRDESYPKAAIQGVLPPEGVIVQFLVLMNNLDVATEYVGRIVGSSLGGGVALADRFPFGNEAVAVEKALRNLEGGFKGKTDELLAEATEVMLKQVLRPRSRPVMIEAFRDVDYLTPSDCERENEEADAMEDDVPKRFERGWQSFTLPIKRILTASNYTRLLTALVSHLARMLEKRLWASLPGRISPLGAVKLERDVSGIVNVACRGGGYELREIFARCVQVVLVVGMEEDEWEEVSGLEGAELERVSGVRWRLDAGDRRRARGLLVGR
ncbi:Golgi transport complex subunit 4 [Vermiconidia calcicola]|uniref:Golgi transport complex subunit 4 n=1 Tax=Vermiconidia calcicola TaxID=1690605 RepID=A0ACC3MKF6_9PEZI|nr:Golgi transport complex subunit 4 [Vermiconidia calcicola]